MMRVRAYATLRDLLGTGKLDLPLGDSSTIGAVLQRLVADYPALAPKLWHEDGRFTGYVTVLLNGRSIEYLRGADTPVGEEDTLSLFPPVGGG
jgi:molybdopterin synthase sulfur carrier subunit